MKALRRVLILSLWACSATVCLGCKVVSYHYKVPDDEAKAICARGTLDHIPFTCEKYVPPGSKTPVSLVSATGSICGTSLAENNNGQTCQIKIAADSNSNSDTNGGSALIVVVEPGTAKAIASLAKQGSSASEFAGLVTSPNIPPTVTDNLRVFISNFVVAYLTHLFTQSPAIGRYTQIYYLMTDNHLKDIFLETLTKATTNHNYVDILVVGHGDPGVMYLDPTLSKGLALSSSQLINYAHSSVPNANRVRSIFQTNCLVCAPGYGAVNSATCGNGTPNSLKPSIYDAYLSAFPNANFYGSNNINFYPIQRDFVAFEQYYLTGNFGASIQFARSQTMNSTTVNYPFIQGSGCVSVLFVPICVKQTIDLGSMNLNQYSYLGSYPYYHLGGSQTYAN